MGQDPPNADLNAPRRIDLRPPPACLARYSYRFLTSRLARSALLTSGGLWRSLQQTRPYRLSVCGLVSAQ